MRTSKPSGRVAVGPAGETELDLAVADGDEPRALVAFVGGPEAAQLVEVSVRGRLADLLIGTSSPMSGPMAS
jgi:hypothetical protein